MKTCSACGETKSLDQFYNNGTSADGKRPDCKTCLDAKMKAYRQANRDRTREADRKRYAANPGKHTQKVLAWKAANREKFNAQQKLRRAVKSGRLIRPTRCEDCNAEYHIIEAHHDDYSKPLDVRWLCPICHRAADQLRLQREAIA